MNIKQQLVCKIKKTKNKLFLDMNSKEPKTVIPLTMAHYTKNGTSIV